VQGGQAASFIRCRSGYWLRLGRFRLPGNWAAVAMAAGARSWIDNSSAFRSDSRLPLGGAEVNPAGCHPPSGLIANPPNCTTILLAWPLAPLPGHRAIRAGGGEHVSIREWGRLARARRSCASSGGTVLDGGEAVSTVLAPLPGVHLFCTNSPLFASGLLREAEKCSIETRKILGLPGLRLLRHLRS